MSDIQINVKKKMNAMQRKENLVGWFYVIVPLLATFVFLVIPSVMSLFISFSSWSGYTSIFSAKFNGWENYYNVLFGIYKEEFFRSILNTLFMVVQLPITLFLSVLIAIMLKRNIRGADVYRLIYYIPSLSTAVVVILIFTNMFALDGQVNKILGVIGIDPIPWLNKKGYATVVIITLSIWKGLGGTVLMYTAGLQSIATEYYEAAELDGANRVKMLFYITLPLLKPMTFFMIITGLMGGMQAFNEPFLMYPYNFGFGPESSTETVMVFMYYQFSQNSKMGIASAISWCLAIIIFVMTIIQFWYNKKVNSDN